MTLERLREMARAYGADPRRWPDAERGSAQGLLAAGTAGLTQDLAAAGALDAWLDSHAVAAPDEALTRRVLASAGAARSGSAAAGQRRWQPTGWWAGAGLLGIGLAGTLAGALVVSLALRAHPPAPSEGPERGTAFSAIPADWSEE